MKFILFISFTFILISCNGSKNSNEVNVKFDSLDHRYYSSIDVKRMLVIRNNDEYRKLWDEFYKDLDQLPAYTEVDFNKYSVIAVFMGVKNTGGYDINVKKVTSKNDKLYIYVTETSPGPNCIVTDALTKPSDFVKIRKTELEAEFKLSSEVKDCK